MQNIKQIPQLRRALDPLPELAQFHPVSGLADRDLFDARVDRHWDWCAHKQRPMTMMIVRIDNSAQVDDEDIVSIALIVAETCRRRADFAGHLRPDEFGVILSDADSTGALVVGEALRQRIRGGSDRYPTVSIGVGHCQPSDNRFAKCIKMAADQALQAAEADGGDTTRVQTLTH